jgi:RimJ/RimL family protein N-acetyltransferase
MHRLATLADIDAVYSIYMEKDVIPYLGYDPMPRADFLAVMEALVASKSFYVVVLKGHIQGFYRASKYDGRARHVAYLGTLAVAPGARGTGLARSMIETAIARLHSEGVVRVELMLEADNPRARQFYSKLGFELEGIMRHAYKRSSDQHYTDELFMAKLLPPIAANDDAA